MTAPDQLLQDASQLAAHPSFPKAVQVYCTALAQLREAPRLVNAIIATDVRWRVVGYLLYLSADRERFGPQGGATYGRLLDLCTQRQEASPRALKTLLALLKVSFLVRVVRDERDARIGYYVPTERMHDFVRNWMRYAVAALDLLQPEIDRSRLLGDPAFAARFHVSGGRAHLADTIPLADRVPEPLSSLKAMLGSYSVIVGVMEAELCCQLQPSAASMAWRFGMSRSQVANVLEAGQQAGVFAFNQAGKITPTPALHDSFRHWISIELAFYARHMRLPSEPIQPVADTLV